MSRKKEEEALDPEEQFVLRILDPQLAEKVKKALQEGATSKVEIVFQGIPSTDPSCSPSSYSLPPLTHTFPPSQ
jgi:hypothetical protein